jgi:hypothetical protein
MFEGALPRARGRPDREDHEEKEYERGHFP